MVTNRAVLGTIADRWDKDGLFEDRWSNLVAGWCVKHYRKYGKPPKRQVELYFDKWSESREGRDRDTVKLVEKFLTAMSSEYAAGKKVQVEHVLDLAGEYFTKVRAEQALGVAESLLEDGKVAEAVTALKSVDTVEVATDSRIYVLNSAEAMKSAFEAKSETLIQYPGPLGVFFGPALERSAFVVCEAIEKAGKSTVLIDMAFRAVTHGGRKVAFFEAGDLTQHQLLMRFYVRAAGHPSRLDPSRPVLVPTAIERPERAGDKPTVVREERKFDKPLTIRRAEKALAKHAAYRDNLILHVHPANTLTVDKINATLDRYERESGWVADVVIVDYIDLLAPADGKAEVRHQINRVWKDLSALRQRRHCLVLGATQASAGGYDTDILTMKHFSENKLKHAHVSGMFGLMRDDEDKQFGLSRLNWIAGRDWEYETKAQVFAAGCPALMSPFMLSAFDAPADQSTFRGRKGRK